MYESPAELQSIQTCVHIINTLLYNPQKKILMFLLNYESDWV